MPAERFDIIFSGELIEGQEPDKVRKRLGRMLKATEEQMDRLFSGKPAVIKRGADMESASKYRLAFRQAGALIHIRPSGTPSAKKQREAAPPAMTLLPPNTGSLEEFAPKLEPEPLPDISAMDISLPGEILDETPAPPPAHISTGDLGLVPGQEWTLEDCRPPPPPPLNPNLDGLDIAPLDDTSHIPPEPPPRPLPAIDALDFAPLDDTSHIPPEPPPAPLPNISAMTLEEPEDEEPENSPKS